MKFDKEKFAIALRVKRGERTLDDISEETGIPKSTLSRIENGKEVKIDTLYSISGWMGISLDFFRRSK